MLDNVFVEYIDLGLNQNHFRNGLKDLKDLYRIYTKSMEIHEINELYKKHIKETAKERLKLTKKDLHNLKTIEKFAIGCYLSQASSKILEISNGFIFELFFQRSLLKEVKHTVL